MSSYKDLAEEAVILSNRQRVRRDAELDRWTAWVGEHFGELPNDEVLIMKALISTGSLGERPLLRALAEGRNDLPPADPGHGPLCACHLVGPLSQPLVDAVNHLRLLGHVDVMMRQVSETHGEPMVVLNQEIRARVETEIPLTPASDRLNRLFHVARTLRTRRPPEPTHTHDYVSIETFLTETLSGVQDADVADIVDTGEAPRCDGGCGHVH